MQNPNANVCDKAWSGAFFAAGVVGPGSGYSKIAKSFSPGQFAMFERQLAQNGQGSLVKSKATLENRIAEHQKKIVDAKANNGFTSSMEKEIYNFQEQINAIDEVLRRK